MLLGVSGLALVPFASALDGLIERRASRGGLTEAFGWLTTAELAGFAIGTLAIGALAESGGPLAASWGAVGATIVTLFAAAVLALGSRDEADG